MMLKNMRIMRKEIRNIRMKFAMIRMGAFVARYSDAAYWHRNHL
jgi:hypothetical protein